MRYHLKGAQLINRVGLSGGCLLTLALFFSVLASAAPVMPPSAPVASFGVASSVAVSQPPIRVLTSAEAQALFHQGILPLPLMDTPETARIALPAILMRVLATNPVIAASVEKATETRYKQIDIKRRRLLLFFRYFTPEALEGSADTDVEAADAHTEAVRQQELLQTIQHYKQWVQALLQEKSNTLLVLQAQNQLSGLQDKFRAGQVTLAELLKQQNQVVEKLQQLKLSRSQAQEAGQYFKILLTPLGKTASPLLLPDELQKMPAMPRLGDILEARLTALSSISSALGTTQPVSRPDLLEMRSRIISVDHLLKTTPLASLPHKILASSLKQLQLKLKRMEEGIALSQYSALQDQKLAQEHLSLAQQQTLLAEKLLQTVQISQKAGFSSQQSTAETRSGLAQAQLMQTVRQWDGVAANAQTLYEFGQLYLVDPRLSLKSAPIDQPRHPFWKFWLWFRH